MSDLYEKRRYLTDFDSRRTGHIFADVLVIGAGVGGARAALEAAGHCDDVLLISKNALEESITRYAQGGVANVRSPEDSPECHASDTIRVGCGLNRPAAVELVVGKASDRIDELVEWGMRFDQEGGQYALTREGGHSIPRILHALGDATGREMVRVLTSRVRKCDAIRVFEDCFVIDLITDDGRCLGAVAFHDTHGHQLIWAKQTILASGGAGRLYRETSNPEPATGDGLAIAYRAGARLADLEMVQFHPTTLYVAGANRALISEAVRGEGGLLLDRGGERFMPSYHPDAELAPRDVVSRAIFRRMRETRTNCVYMDVRHVVGSKFAARFPGITRLCASFQIDVSRDLIPVRPAAHYMIGGVVTDLDGTTDVDGLLCCGEAACTGLHGANRLASNSLLEGLVFGAIAGATAGHRVADSAPRPGKHLICTNARSARTALDLPDIRNSLRSVMWRNVGIERNGDRLAETREIIDFWGHYVLDKTFEDAQGWETQNMLSAARLMVTAARARTESLGVHFRADAPADHEPGPLEHVIIRRTADHLSVERAGLDFGWSS